MRTDDQTPEQTDQFAPVGQDIHEDMARIYEIVTNPGVIHDDPEGVYEAIAAIARGWIED